MQVWASFEIKACSLRITGGFYGRDSRKAYFSLIFCKLNLQKGGESKNYAFLCRGLTEH
ncbi:hypothetical protein HMPREF1981_00295 [Bacteroides pyogenes F0041]|uniref:Uncharacterized protein n=1 Tax=Bacteroides pyogenes F0041 TaxID=1321819 RepID=U2CXI3_9BACE|nr:hypothetical protein HMPREF1981_00295 [Bacteroides pyogenes F0041]GAE23139.1 hypothetical protein JCM10003_2845 [Bacteroides pyogenes JCM 10003]